jgi:hypothetical protein
MVSVYCDNNPAETRSKRANFCAVVCGKLFHDCDMRIQISCLIRRGRAREVIWGCDDMVIFPNCSSSARDTT